jgi:hypothetical protein
VGACVNKLGRCCVKFDGVPRLGVLEFDTNWKPV